MRISDLLCPREDTSEDSLPQTGPEPYLCSLRRQDDDEQARTLSPEQESDLMRRAERLAQSSAPSRWERFVAWLKRNEFCLALLALLLTAALAGGMDRETKGEAGVTYGGMDE